MQHTLDSKQKALYHAIGEILHFIWDPIGVAGVPQARDEYDSYVAQIFSLVNSGAGESAIAHRLNEIAAVSMGLENVHQCSANAASVLVDWRDYINEVPA